MTTHDDFDGRLTAWLDGIAPSAEPDALLARVLERTATTSRRPAWAIPERWIPMTSITTPTTALGRFPWRTVALIAALVALLAGAFLVAGSQRQDLPPAFGVAGNGALVYSMDGSIRGVDAPTGAPRTLIPDANTPWFSNDGTRFFFYRGDPATRDAELWLANADGTDAHKLTDAPRTTWVEWSPEGDMLALSNWDDPSAITMIQADGSGSTPLETGLQRVERPIFRPPDGATLTFRGTANGTDWGLYQMHRDGSDLVKLELDPGFLEDQFYGENAPYYFLDHTWDPTGQRLLFHTLEPAPGAPAGPGFRLHLADVDVNGTVTDELILDFDAEMDDEFAALFLPDGERFVYQSIEGTEHRLWLVDTADPTTSRDLGVKAADWFMRTLPSPDGTQVITSQPGPSGAWVVSVDLASGTVTSLDIGEDVSWQRIAP